MTGTEPRSMTPANLSGAFQKRAAAPTLAKTRVEQTAAETQPTQVPADPTPSRKRTKADRTRSSTETVPAPRPAEATGTTPTLSPKAAYILLELRDRLNERAKVDGRSQTNVVLDAIEATYDELQAAFAGTGSAGRTLFRRTPKLHRRDDAERGQITLRLTDEDSQVIENLTREFGAKSRSELIEKALSLYLT